MQAQTECVPVYQEFQSEKFLKNFRSQVIIQFSDFELLCIVKLVTHLFKRTRMLVKIQTVQVVRVQIKSVNGKFRRMNIVIYSQQTEQFADWQVHAATLRF